MNGFMKSTCVLALSVMALSAQSISTLTVETTGMVGLAEGETARLNLLNIGVLPPAVGTVCVATVSYIDATGAALKTATVTILPGRSQPVDLNSVSDLSLASGTRREIRAQISTQNSCKLLPTLEVFDSSSGRDQIITGHTVSVPSVTAAAAN